VPPPGRSKEHERQISMRKFKGKKTLEKQRMVYSAIKELMAGNNAPVHAIDILETLIPET